MKAISATQRYVSNELTHFVGRSLRDEKKDENQIWDEQYGILRKIIHEKRISYSPHETSEGGLEYGTPSRNYFEFQSKFSNNGMIVPGMVCFCDIPLEDIAIHISKYSHFGLSFQKSFLIKQGTTPVFYVEKNSIIRNYPSQKNTARSEYFDEMVDHYIKYCNNWLNYIKNFPCKIEPRSKECIEIGEFMLDLLSYIKFFDANKSDADEENFYMEREWRSLFYINFEIENIRRIILPSSFSKRFRSDVPEYYGEITFSDQLAQLRTARMAHAV